MGYTHCYNILRPEDLMIREIGEDIRLLIKQSTVRICGPFGEPETAPIITPEKIAFNGMAPNDDCESFVWPPDPERINPRAPGFGFTKTERKPYDEVVAASHLVLKHHLQDWIRIDSNGKMSEEIWLTAVALHEATFPGRTVPELDNEDNDGDLGLPPIMPSSLQPSLFPISQSSPQFSLF